jgi:hypothetical protein
MSQIDHCICQGLQSVVQLTFPFKAKQQPLEFLLPGEHALNREKALGKNFFVEDALWSRLRRFLIARVLGNIGNHVMVEDGFPVLFAVIDTVEAHDAPIEVESDKTSNREHFWQFLAKKRGFVVIAGSTDERGDHIAVAIAKRHDFVTLEVLMAVVSEVVAAFLRRRTGTIAVNDFDIELAGLV